MAFALDTRNIKSLVTYSEAHQKWANTKPWRTGSDWERPLESRTKKHCSIVFDPYTKAITTNLYRTPLVIFHENGHTQVRVSYQSVSTDNFINAVLGRSPRYFMVNRQKPTVWSSGWTDGQYVSDTFAEFDADWNLLNPAPIKVPMLDKKQTAALRKEMRYDKFKVWRAAYEAMNPYVPRYSWHKGHERPNTMRSEAVEELLRDGPQSWIKLSKECTNDYILDAIYREHPQVVTFTTLERLEDTKQWTNICSLDHKYAWAVV